MTHSHLKDLIMLSVANCNRMCVLVIIDKLKIIYSYVNNML